MALDQPRPRRHSLSNEDASPVRSHSGWLGDDSAQSSFRRVRLPRSKSTSNMLDVTNLPLRTTSADDLRDAVREQIHKDDLRALAEFFRTTSPPSDTLPSPDECFGGFTGSKVSKKFSSSSLRLGKKAKGPTRSIQTQLPKNVIPETTTAGNRHIAITIPPYNKRSTWLRSQYPVFASGNSTRVVAGPKEWPERISSKGTVSNSTQDQRRDTSVSAVPPLTRGVKHERSLTGSLSVVRLATAKPALNPVEEDHETSHDQYSAGIVTPLTAPSRHLYQSVSANFNHDTLAFRHPSMDFKFPITNTTSEIHDSGSSTTFPHSLRHRRQLSRMSKKSKDFGSQNSARSSSEQPTDLTVQPSLAVPKASVISESPGFPNMLAKMNFPSPPTTSRPSSRANSISSSLNQLSLTSPITPPIPTRTPTPTATPPIIQPRTTSRRACVTPFSSSASLNEVMMRHAQTPGTAHSSKDSITTSIRPNSSQSRGEYEPQVELSRDELKKDDEATEEISHGLAPTVTVESRYSLESNTNGESRLQRQSTSSNITGTTDASSQLATTASSFRSSARSDLTTSTFNTVKDGVWGQEALPNRDSAVSIGPLPIMIFDKPEFTDSPTLGNGDFVGDRMQLGTDANFSLSTRRGSLPRPGSAGSFASLDEEELEPNKMAERRMARKARVKEYKQRDLTAVRVGQRTSMVKLGEPLMDSPVLGWFPQEARRPLPQNPSPLAQTSPWSSSPDLNTGAQNRHGSGNAAVRSDLRPPERIITAQDAGFTQPEARRNGWGLSPVMVSADLPAEEHESSSWPLKNELVISPMMEIASIEPYQESEQKTVHQLEDEHRQPLGEGGEQQPEPELEPEQEFEQKPKSKRPTRHLSTLLLLEGVSSIPGLDGLSSTPGSRASLRPKLKSRPMSRSKPPPVTISRNPITGAIERTTTPPKAANCYSYNHGFVLNPAIPSAESPRRWSFPVRAISPTLPSTSWDRPLSSPVEEVEEPAEESSEEELDTKSRIDIIKERLQRQKEENEREIENIVARTVVQTPGPSYKEADDGGAPESPAKNGMGEVERRLKRLEKNGDAWLRVMGPLLENMTKTLEAMHGDGVGIRSDLTMNEFMIDMDAEARRFSLMNQNMPGAALLQAAATQQGGGGSLNSTSSTTRQHSVSPSLSSIGGGSSGGKDRKKIGRGRSSSSLARLRLQLDRAAKKSIDLTASRHTPDYEAPQDSAKSGLGLLSPLTPSSAAAAVRPTTPRSPLEHDFEVEMVIRQRIKKQEAEFNELMSRWNSSATRSRRPSVASGDDDGIKPDVPPLELPQNILGERRSNNSDAETRRSLDMLKNPPPVATLGRRRTNAGGSGAANGAGNLSP